MGHCHGHPTARSPGLAPQTDTWHLLWHAVLTGTWTEVLGQPSVGDGDSAVWGNHGRAADMQLVSGRWEWKYALSHRSTCSYLPVSP